jgi:FkbM family methyltransferase
MSFMLQVTDIINKCQLFLQDMYVKCLNGEAVNSFDVKKVNEACDTIYDLIRVEFPLEKQPLLEASRIHPNDLESMAEWLALTKTAASTYSIDCDFIDYIKKISSSSKEQILNHIIKKYKELSLDERLFFDKLYGSYSAWGTLDESNGDFNVYEKKAETLRNNWKDLLWLYTQLGDYRSRAILCAVIDNWYNMGSTMLGNNKELCYMQYFDLDLIQCGPDEVFVDAGAYDGGTVIDYLNVYGGGAYKNIYCYEITSIAFEALSKNLAGLPHIQLNKKGVAEKPGFMYIVEHDDFTSIRLSDTGSVPVETVTLDEDISEPVTFIKMDIEGSEQIAIRGAARHIREDRPKLAISLYHKNDDIWEIPRLIEQIAPGYQFYLRYYGSSNFVAELVLIAIP